MEVVTLLNEKDLLELGVDSLADRKVILRSIANDLQKSSAWRRFANSGQLRSVLDAVVLLSTVVLTIIAILSLQTASIERELNRQSLEQMGRQLEVSVAPVLSVDLAYEYLEVGVSPGISPAHMIQVTPASFVYPETVLDRLPPGQRGKLPLLRITNHGNGPASDVRVSYSTSQPSRSALIRQAFSDLPIADSDLSSITAGDGWGRIAGFELANEESFSAIPAGSSTHEIGSPWDFDHCLVGMAYWFTNQIEAGVETGSRSGNPLAACGEINVHLSYRDMLGASHRAEYRIVQQTYPSYSFEPPDKHRWFLRLNLVQDQPGL